MSPLTDFEPRPGFVQLISPAPDRPPAASKLRRSKPLGSPRSAPSPRAQRTASCGAIRITPCPGRVLPAHSPWGDVSWLLVAMQWTWQLNGVTSSADRVGFDVAVVGVGGFVQTTLGFTSEAAANAWVNQAMRLTKPWATSRTFGRQKHYQRPNAPNRRVAPKHRSNRHRRGALSISLDRTAPRIAIPADQVGAIGLFDIRRCQAGESVASAELARGR